MGDPFQPCHVSIQHEKVTEEEHVREAGFGGENSGFFEPSNAIVTKEQSSPMRNLCKTEERQIESKSGGGAFSISQCNCPGECMQPTLPPGSSLSKMKLHAKKTEFVKGEMSDPFQPSYAIIKEEPMTLYSNTNEKPHLEPLPSQAGLHLENTQAQPGSSVGTTEVIDDDAYWPLSGKPYFHMIFAKSHVSRPYKLLLPKPIIRQLPNAIVPVFLTYCGKTWEMIYYGAKVPERFGSNWMNFVMDNNLKIGDSCVFELTECSQTKITFKTQILRCNFLAMTDDDDGDCEDAPIMIN